MPTVDESIEGAASSPLAGAQGAGLDAISQGACYTFTLYRRVVLPIDGSVFWVKADALGPGSGPNTSPLNTFQLNQGQAVLTPAETQDVPGSLHHTTLNQQDEAESFSLQQFVLTTQQPVDALASVAPDCLWIGECNGYKLAFSSRTGFYRQANTYHYRGDALYPALATQVVDDPADIDLANVVVSNSLPIWLTLNQLFPVYPSFLVPDNIEPPYAVVHIDPNDTMALTASRYEDCNLSRWQLTKDRVKVTTYGVRNFTIMDWLDLVEQYTLDNPMVMGLMNNPVPRDEKRGQTEFSILAQKKTLYFEVNYYQLRVRDVARQLIEQVFTDFAIATSSTFTTIGPAPSSPQ